jgi:GTPase KRas
MTDYKLVVVGGEGVGKTAMTIHFIQGVFVDEYEHSYRKQVKIDESICLLDMLDTAGQGENSAMRDRYMRTGQTFLIVYSITSRASFEEVETFREQIIRAKGDEPCNIPIVLVGNKSDLEAERVISTTEGIALAQYYNCPFFETSAKSGINIEESFFQLVREYITKQLPSSNPVRRRKKNAIACTLF